MSKAFLANVCLLFHIFGSTVRCWEALSVVRDLMQGIQQEEDEDNSPPEDDCYDPFVSDMGVASSAGSIDSPRNCDPGGLPQEEDRAVGEQGLEVDGDDGAVEPDFADSEDEDLVFALPVEEEKRAQSAFKGTRGRKVGRKVGFYRGGRTVCEGGPIIPSLVDGSWCDEEYRTRAAMSFARALGRARRQQCQVVSELPACTRGAICDATRDVYIYMGTEALIVDKRCKWSSSGYEAQSVHSKDGP